MSKRRRRRTSRKQSSKSSSDGQKTKFNPLIIVLVTGGVLLIGLFLILMFARSGIEGWLRGEGFRSWLQTKTSAVLKAEVSLSHAQWDGSEVFVEDMRARGYEDAAFSNLRLEGVRSTYGGIREQAFHIPEIAINRLNLDFSPNRKAGTFANENPNASKSADNKDKAELPGWLASRVPNRMDVENIRIGSTNLAIKNGAGEEALVLSSMRTNAQPDFDTSIWEIRGQEGRLHIAGQPQMEIRNLSVRWQLQNLFINDFTLGIYEKGFLEGNGEISFETGQPQIGITTRFSRIKLHEVLSDEVWKSRVQGSIQGEITHSGAPTALRKKGTIRLNEGEIKDTPFLDTIAMYTRNDLFKRMALNEASCEFEQEGENIFLRNIALQSDGLIRIEGDLDLIGETIDGRLQLGVTPGTLRVLPEAEKIVFTESRDGILWTSLRITGTKSNPQEDLTKRLLAAAPEAMMAKAAEEAQKVLSGDTSGLRDGANLIKESGEEIIKKTFQSILGK